MSDQNSTDSTNVGALVKKEVADALVRERELSELRSVLSEVQEQNRFLKENQAATSTANKEAEPATSRLVPQVLETATGATMVGVGLIEWIMPTLLDLAPSVLSDPMGAVVAGLVIGGNSAIAQKLKDILK